jgi:thymidylate synthase
MTFNVTDGKLNAILNQRSQDMLTANNWNVVQYSMLVIMLAKVCNLEVGEFVHVIADAHVYDRHEPLCEELFTRVQYPAPKLVIKRDVTDFYDFKVEDFELEGYQFTPMGKKIEVAI